MLSTSVLSFSNRRHSSSLLTQDEEDEESEHLLIGYPSSATKTTANGLGENSVTSGPNRRVHPFRNQMTNGMTNGMSNGITNGGASNGHHHRHHHRNERSSLSSVSMGSTLTSVKVKYLGSIKASARSSAILNKGITAIQSGLLDLYTIAQRKFVNSISNGRLPRSDYQVVEICNYGVVIGEPDPSARTTLSVVGSSNPPSPPIVVTQVITPLSNIVLWAGIRFHCRPVKVKGRPRSSAAFIPLSCSSAVYKASSYTPLSTSRSRFLSSVDHPPLFLIVLRKVSSPKTFESHLFACCTIEDAIHLSSNLSEVQNGINKVGPPSVAMPLLDAHSYTSFEDQHSRTSSRQLSLSSVNQNHQQHHPPHHHEPNQHHSHHRSHQSSSSHRGQSILRNESPSQLTDEASRLTVNTEPVHSGLSISTTISSPTISTNNLPMRREMFNYRRELGLRPWPSSVGPKLETIKQREAKQVHSSSLGSSSEVSNLRRRKQINGKTLIQPDDQLSQQSTATTTATSYTKMCQSCSTNGQGQQQRVKRPLDNHQHVNGSSSPVSGPRYEVNNYNGYLVPSNQIDLHLQPSNHRSTDDLVVKQTKKVSPVSNGNIVENQINKKITVPRERLKDNHNRPSRSGRREERKLNGSNLESGSKSSRNGIQFTSPMIIPIEDYPLTEINLDSISDQIVQPDGLVYVNNNNNTNVPMKPVYPPMIKINSNANRWPAETIYQPRAQSRSSNSLFRRLGRWKLRSWMRKSLNLRFRRKRKRCKQMDLFADRDLRYLSLAEPLDYENRLSNRLQLSPVTPATGPVDQGYYLGMETLNDNNNNNNRNGYPVNGIIATQEIPEELGLENLRQIIERKPSTCYQVIACDQKTKSTKKITRNGKSVPKATVNGKTSVDQSLSKIDLLNELGYLP